MAKTSDFPVGTRVACNAERGYEKRFAGLVGTVVGHTTRGSTTKLPRVVVRPDAADTDPHLAPHLRKLAFLPRHLRRL